MRNNWTLCARCLQHGAALIVLSGAAFATPDILHLKSGGRIDGQVIARSDETLTIRTAVGMVKLPADAIEQVERGPSAIEEYGVRKADLPDVASAHVALAEWCAANDLLAERRRHLQRAVELDPNHEAARTALGFVRIGQLWVDGRAVTSEKAEKSAVAKRAATPEEQREEETRLTSAIQVQWARQIRAIRDNMLETSDGKLRAQGREKIEAIVDPLAVLPLARELIRGSVFTRATLVENLTRFTEDEATLNLAALALVDPSPELRRAALTPLVQRQDARVASQFRKALRSDNDELIRRAAIALGILRDSAAVSDLINALTVQRIRAVEMPVRRYFADYPAVFNRHSSVQLGSRRVTFLPRVGVVPGLEGGGLILTSERRYQPQAVTVYRSEVLDALVQITGENFGFDEPAWRRWHQEFDQWKTSSGLAR